MKSLKVQFVLLFLCLTCSSFGQLDTTYDQLVEGINRYLIQYGEVQVFGGYYSIKDLGLTEVEKNQLIEESDYDDSLTPEKDSIRAFPLIEFLQERIVDGLQKITEHEGFQAREIQDLIHTSVLQVLKSADHKLLIFSFDMKNGGTYKGEIAMIYYEGLGNSETNSDSFSQIRREGVFEIHTIDSKESRKYLLEGGVVGCASCYESFVQLIQPKEDRLESQFEYALNLRNGWENPIDFDPETQRIIAEYETDDLTTECICENQWNDEESYLYTQKEKSQEKKCRCVFEFKGDNFERVEFGDK